MHIYIYSSFLGLKKYFSELQEIEGKLTDLGLNGRICRLGRLRSLRDVLRDELRRAPKTIVAVGDDDLISQVIGLMGSSGVSLGMIPLGENNQIAQSFGINAANACNVLAARRTIEIDLGLVDGRAFVRRAEIVGPRLKLLIDGNYQIKASDARVEAINFTLDTEEFSSSERPTPQSGCLYLLITKESGGFLKKSTERSFIPFRQLAIETDEASVNLDSSVKINHPRQVTILPNGLKIIVGRERNF